MKRTTGILLALLMVLLVIGTAACSQKAEEGPAPAPPSKGIAVPAPAPAPSIAPAPRPAPAPAPAPIIKVPSEGGFGTDVSQVIDQERKIIRNAYMSLVVENVSGTMQQITNLAAQYGGYVVNSDVRQDRDRMIGNISIRVLSTGFNNAIAALRGMAVEVKAETTTGKDVTEEFVDLEARLGTLEAAKTQLEELMKKTSDKVTDILEVQRELTRVTGEIEQTKGRMKFLEQSSDLAMIQVQLEQNKLTLEFNAETRSVKEGDRVQFFAIISGGFAPYSYQWSFGDRETSTEPNPSHAYKTDGTYTVTLKVTDDKGNTVDATRQDYITVLPGWDIGNVSSGIWNAAVGFVRFIVSVFIVIAYFSWFWIPVLIILYFAWWRRRKKKSKKE